MLIKTTAREDLECK